MAKKRMNMAPIVIGLGVLGAALYFGMKLGDNNRPNGQTPPPQLPPPNIPTIPGQTSPGLPTIPGQPATLGNCIADDELREEFLIQLQDPSVPPATLDMFANALQFTCPIEATALRTEAARRRTMGTSGVNFPPPPPSPDMIDAWAAGLHA